MGNCGCPGGEIAARVMANTTSAARTPLATSSPPDKVTQLIEETARADAPALEPLTPPPVPDSI